MKGKNAGKVRAPRQRKGDCPHESYKADLLTPTFCKRADGNETNAMSVPRAVGNSFSLFTFPCEMRPYMRSLITQCKEEASVSTLVYLADSIQSGLSVVMQCTQAISVFR
jgi:hypothetical protein